MPSFAVRNFGCRVNLAESFGWVEALRRRGLRFEEDGRRGDLVIVNTCTLTARADRDVRKALRAVARDNPGAKLVVTGCLAERAPREFARDPRIALVLGNREKPDLVDRVMALLGPEAISAGPAGAASAAESATERRGWGGGEDEDGTFRVRAWLKVQDGCDRRCAFCVIPSVRGPSVSVPPGEVLDAVGSAAERGYREIVLTGIDLSSYGSDLEPPTTLAALLRRIVEVPGLGRVRLSSLDPGRVDAALAELAAPGGKVCRHFHLSLQHASEPVLRSMGRAADPGMCARLLAFLREAVPGVALGADVIAGFPGETEEDFERLRAFLEGSPLAYFHVFSYSPRPGTPAEGRPRVPDAVVTARASALRRLAAVKSLAFRRANEGRTLEAAVIVRGGGPEGARSKLLTDNYIKVEAPPAPVPEGGLVRVRVTRARERSTDGEFVV